MTLGQAIDMAVKRSSVRTQETLAELLDLDQTTVSRMIRGSVSVSVDRIAIIEDLCKVPRGWILWTAGYVDDRWLREPTFVVGGVLDQLEIEQATNVHPIKRDKPMPAAAHGGDAKKPGRRRANRPKPPPEPEGP